MAVQRLVDAMAFSAGASLWILPTATQSVWARKLDWYLNFIAAHALLHRPPEISQGMRDMLKEIGLAEPSTEANNQRPLLIRASHRLPTTQLVEVNYADDAKAWISAAVEVWLGLGKPAVRVFLPPKLSQSEAEKLWGDTSEETLSLVADSEHLVGG